MALAVTSSTLSGAHSSRKILHKAGRNVRGGQLKKKHKYYINNSNTQNFIMQMCFLSPHKTYKVAIGLLIGT